MSLSYIFGTGTSWQASWLDTDFAEVGACTTIPCSVSGTNTLVVSPNASTPAPTSYAPYQRYGFIATATNLGATTANVSSLGALSVYKDSASGPTSLVGGEIVIGNYCVIVYDPALNSGNGGFHLETALSIAAGTVTAVVAGTGLDGGTISTTGTLSLAQIPSPRMLANTSGSTAAPVSTTGSAFLDSVFGITQGTMIFRGSSVWGALTPGTLGQYLYSSGSAPSWQGGVATGISASGTSQTAATQLAAEFNQVGIVGSGAGVILATGVGVPQYVWNDGANSLLVYPPVGAQINNLGTNTPATISTLSVAGYVMLSSTLAKTLP